MKTYPEWAKPGERVVCSLHGTGYVTTVGSGLIGVHFDTNKRDNNTDCWYKENANGQYISGTGRCVLSPEKNAQ